MFYTAAGKTVPRLTPAQLLFLLCVSLAQLTSLLIRPVAPSDGLLVLKELP